MARSRTTIKNAWVVFYRLVLLFLARPLMKFFKGAMSFLTFLPRQREMASSVTRLGDFLKFLETIYVSKVARMFSDFWGILKTSHSK